MSTSRPLDPRVRRTRRLLQDALLALAEEQDFAAITVGEITRRADVNRNTFYLHYRDKDDLVTQTLDALFDELTAPSRTFVDSHKSLAPDVVPDSTLALFQELGHRHGLYRRLMGEAGSTTFADRVRAFHERQFLRLWHDLRVVAAPGSPPPELRARLGATAMEGAIGWWLSEGEAVGADQAAAWSWQLLSPLWFAAIERDSVST
jgi:AcrR family transcriptional regulator